MNISPFFAGFFDCLPFSLWKQVVTWQCLKCHILILALFKTVVWICECFFLVAKCLPPRRKCHLSISISLMDFVLDEFLFMQIWHLFPKNNRCKWEKKWKHFRFWSKNDDRERRCGFVLLTRGNVLPSSKRSLVTLKHRVKREAKRCSANTSAFDWTPKFCPMRSANSSVDVVWMNNSGVKNMQMF